MDINIEDTRQPPDGISYATCAICGETHDLGDMEQVADDIWVCDIWGADCLREWHEQNPEEEK